MSYSAWSVVFGEQPSAAKWNILGTNDAAFNNGSGFQNNVILSNALGLATAYDGTNGVKTYTNAGSAGGTNSFFYINLGGIKLLWGTTGTFTISGSGFQTSSTLNLTLPASFFSTIQYSSASLFSPGNTNFLSFEVTGANTTTINILMTQNNGTNGTGIASVLVVGT